MPEITQLFLFFNKFGSLSKLLMYIARDISLLMIIAEYHFSDFTRNQ